MYRPSSIAMYFTNIKGIFTELPQPPLHSTPGVFLLEQPRGNEKNHLRPDYNQLWLQITSRVEVNMTKSWEKLDLVLKDDR